MWRTDDWDELVQTPWSLADVSVGDRLLLCQPGARSWPTGADYGVYATVLAVEHASADAAARAENIDAAEARLAVRVCANACSAQKHMARLSKDKIVVSIGSSADGGAGARELQEVHLEAVEGAGSRRMFGVCFRGLGSNIRKARW